MDEENAARAEVRGTLDRRRLRPIIGALQARTEGAHGPVIVDLRGVTFIHPFPVVALMAHLEAGEFNRNCVEILCPTHVDPLNYLAACGFIQEAAKCVAVRGDHGRREKDRSWSARTILPLTRLAADSDIGDVLNRVDARLQGLLGREEREGTAVRGAIRSTVKEICANIFHHARCDIGWIAAQQYFNRYTGAPYVEIAIADAGQGIRASLSTAHQYLEGVPDSEAIEAALNGLSRRTGSHHGTGFFVLRRAAAELDGRFYVRSGRGSMILPRRRRLQRRDEPDCWSGTFLEVALGCQ